MRRRCGSGRQCGYVSVYFALLLTFVLIPALMLALDGANLAYNRARAQNLAEAAALAAVKDTMNIHIPIPDLKKTIYGIPYDGWFLNTLHLKNVKPSLGFLGIGGESDLKMKDQLVGYYNGRAGTTELKLQPIQTSPLGNTVSPIMVVRAPVTVDVKLMTPLLSQVMNGQAKVESNKGQTFTVRAEACAMAWYRLDYIWHGWWDKRTADWMFGVGDKPLKYYRSINCIDGGWGEKTWDVTKLADPIITEYLLLKFDKDKIPNEAMAKVQKEVEEYLVIVADWLGEQKNRPPKEPPPESEFERQEREKGKGTKAGKNRTLGDCTNPEQCGEEAGKEYEQEKKRYEEEQERLRQEEEHLRQAEASKQGSGQ